MAFCQLFVRAARAPYNPRYVWTVTSGTFTLSVPRLRWFCGSRITIHSGCHTASEGVIGINLHADGSTNYVLAVGSAYFEFIALENTDTDQPQTVALQDLIVGADYEVVLTSSAGLYRYRLGDVIRIVGWQEAAPIYEFLYRRGTVLNLFGEKTNEFHTATALGTTVAQWLGQPDAVREYTVYGAMEEGVGRYTFYVELAASTALANQIVDLEAILDRSLAGINPYYYTSGRQLGRLAPVIVKVVRPGTFEQLLELQLRHAAPASATQVKIPRIISRADQLELLERQVVSPPARAALAQA